MMTRKTKVPNPQIPNPHPNCLVQEVHQDQYHQRFEPKIKLCKKKLMVAESRSEATFIKKKKCKKPEQQ